MILISVNPIGLFWNRIHEGIINFAEIAKAGFGVVTLFSAPRGNSLLGFITRLAVSKVGSSRPLSLSAEVHL